MTGIIVVGVDASVTAQRAAETARDLALALNSTLHVITAFDHDRTEVFGNGSDKRIMSGADEAEKSAGKVAAAIDKENLVIEYFAVRGTPAQALITHAETYDARMIVVGNKGMKGMQRVLGSIPNNVAHNAPCDVYIVRTDQG